jgi:putative Mg2+ transporter-C (MgtC) family protein
MPATFDLNSLFNDPQVTAVLRIALAGVVAGLIGLERELAGKAAGIRTYGLVGVGAAMFTVTAIYGFGSLDYASRIVGGVITGIGFLGAGAILHTKVHVVGLTTAAVLWVAAGVGLAIGSGMYFIGIGSGLVLFVLLQFAAPEEFIRTRRQRAGLDTMDPENDFVADAVEDADSERLEHSPRPLSAGAQRPPLNAWPTQLPAPSPYGPWSTQSQQQLPPQTYGRS